MRMEIEWFAINFDFFAFINQKYTEDGYRIRDYKRGQRDSNNWK